MKGCIIEGSEIEKVFNCIKELKNYNWLITDMECYTDDKNLLNFIDNKYCWVHGKDLLKLLKIESSQWVWGVFSAFSKNIELNDVLKYEYPYADGYKGFWKNPLTIQHPLATLEFVIWDGNFILVISEDHKIISDIMKKNNNARDLELYNTFET